MLDLSTQCFLLAVLMQLGICQQTRCELVCVGVCRWRPCSGLYQHYSVLLQTARIDLPLSMSVFNVSFILQVVKYALCTYGSFVFLYSYYSHPSLSLPHSVCFLPQSRLSRVTVQKAVSGVMGPCCLSPQQPVPCPPRPHPPSR